MSPSLSQFFNKKIPKVFENYESIAFNSYSQDQILRSIDFHPPFLKTEKLVIFKEISDYGITNFRSIGMGMVYPNDTKGHYNFTIYLAMCGWLMASTASVHLAIINPKTAPQVVEADKVRPYKGLGDYVVIKPRPQGSTFWVETVITKTKLKFVLTVTNIVFGEVLYGTIEALRFMITPKDSIWRAKEIPEYDA